MVTRAAWRRRVGALCVLFTFTAGCEALFAVEEPEPKREIGFRCDDDAQCVSGSCIDAICCKSACKECQTCSAIHSGIPGSDGECHQYKPGLRPECDGT